MKPNLERVIYLLLLAALSGYLLKEGAVRAELNRQTAMQPEDLFKRIAGSQKQLQIVDVRPLTDEDDVDVGGYEDSRIPRALPFPGCDESKAPAAALARISPYLPTVIVSRDGNPAALEACAGKFRLARNLAGGMKAWLDRGYPEDSGEYVAPAAGGGGGCL